MKKFTLRQLEYFVAVGQYNNVTEAARQLRVSQPAITGAIAHLEGVFRTQFFHRHHGLGVSPTAAGQIALQEARKILALVKDFPDAQISDPQNVNGTVVLGCFEPLACYHLPALLKALTKELPLVRIEFELLTQNRIHDELLTGQIELGLSYDSGFWEDLGKEVLFQVSTMAVLPESHPLAAQPIVSLEELVNEPFILVDLPESREFQLSLLHTYGHEPNVLYYCSNLEVLRGLVAHGLGVSLSVTRPVGDRSYDGHAIAYRPLVEDIPRQTVVIAYPNGVKLTRAAIAVLHGIRSYFCKLSAAPRSSTAADA